MEVLVGPNWTRTVADPYKGVRYSNDKPGLGIDIDEKVAARYPPTGNFGSERGAHDPEGAPRRP